MLLEKELMQVFFLLAQPGLRVKLKPTRISLSGIYLPYFAPIYLLLIFGMNFSFVTFLKAF